MKLVEDISHYLVNISVAFDVLAKVIMACIGGLVFKDLVDMFGMYMWSIMVDILACWCLKVGSWNGI